MLVLKRFDIHKLSETQSIEVFNQISNWEKESYGDNRFRTACELSACVEKDNTGLYLAFYKNELVGSIDIWQLTENFYAELRSSLVVEEALSPEVIISPMDKQTNLWYVGSMIISDEFSQIYPVRSALLFKRLCTCIRNHLINKTYPLSILGAGSSEIGQKTLLRWGFSLIAADENAIDTPDRPRFEKKLAFLDGSKTYDLRSN
jgi:hypothetical protein